MKRTLLLALIPLACTAFAADEAGDRAAIIRVIAALNDLPGFASPAHSALFTDDADGRGVLLQLMKDKSRSYAVAMRSEPIVEISHEPWGEAQILWPHPAGTLVNPHVDFGIIRFITPEVALVDAVFVYRDGDRTETTPLLVVFRRSVEWRIASIRLLAPNQARPAER